MHSDRSWCVTSAANSHFIMLGVVEVVEGGGTFTPVTTAEPIVVVKFVMCRLRVVNNNMEN